MATILNSKKSTIGSPYVYYTIEAKTSNRTINGITIKFDITAWLGSSGSSLGSGSTMGIIGYLKVLGTEYSVTIKGTSDKWSGTTKHTVSKTITIETGLNPIDTSITGITFRTTRTGSANDGEIANSGELEATDCSNITFEAAHTPPTDVTYTMVETNQKLIAAGISDNIFVKDLSIKSFDISGTLHDDASIKKYAIFNRLNVFSTTTLPVIVDLTQNELQTDITYVSKIPIRAQIVDTFETAGYSTNDLYEYIQYNRINLVETSTTVKRNGQLSGKTKLNVKGNLFNGIVGNVDQSTYKPIVKYKFWQTGTEEPTSYDYEIPSDNITIENGVFSVSNYEIGSSVETDINWFNPDNAYKVKIYIEDNFTNYESQEKSIPVGEATWTEYKDRVDFKKITIKGNEVVLNDYSTEEIRVGTWINGKPLYKKVIILENGTNTTNTVTYALSNYNIKDVEEIFVVHPSYYSADTYTYPFSYYDGNKFMVQVSPTNLKITVSYLNIAKSKMLITLEYTKTTD